jgi:Major Facilitator Superfamily
MIRSGKIKVNNRSKYLGVLVERNFRRFYIGYASVGAGTAFFQPVLKGLTVALAPRERLGDANALFGMAQPGAQVAGPALAGVLIAAASPAAVIAVDAASYAVSAIALTLLRFPPDSGRAPGPRCCATSPKGGRSSPHAPGCGCKPCSSRCSTC